jgi:hypothetical protein
MELVRHSGREVADFELAPLNRFATRLDPHAAVKAVRAALRSN